MQSKRGWMISRLAAAHRKGAAVDFRPTREEIHTGAFFPLLTSSPQPDVRRSPSSSGPSPKQSAGCPRVRAAVGAYAGSWLEAHSALGPGPPEIDRGRYTRFGPCPSPGNVGNRSAPPGLFARATHVAQPG